MSSLTEPGKGGASYELLPGYYLMDHRYIDWPEPTLRCFATEIEVPTNPRPLFANMNDHTDDKESIHLYIKKGSSNGIEIIILLEELG